MALKEIQDALAALYDVQVDHDVMDFVCDAALVEHTTGGSDCGEVLLVAEDGDDGVLVALYVAPEAREVLGEAPFDAWHDDERVWAASLATEGVSHFLYLMFRVENDRAVSQLELELQAEVDKYATALLGDGAESTSDLAGNGVNLIRKRSRALRARIFDGAEFIDDERTEAGERYRIAHRLGRTYAARLERLYVDVGDLDALRRELRRFYRLGLREKLETITR